MNGCRALTDDAVMRVSQAFRSTYAVRDWALFLLGAKTGYRLSELLSLISCTFSGAAHVYPVCVDKLPTHIRWIKSGVTRFALTMASYVATSRGRYG
jgi:hypothetical protein